MKNAFYLVMTALLLQSGLALASTDPAAVPKIDKIREGDLAVKAAAFFASTKPKGCEDPTGKTTFSAAKMGSGSAMDDKVKNSTLTYSVTYLVTAVCNTGSTFSGAYREVTAAAIIDATRKGRVRDGGSPLIPTEPDQFKVIREIEVSTLSSPNQQ